MGYAPAMHLTLARVVTRTRSRSSPKDGVDALTKDYLERCSGFARCQEEAFRTDQALLEWLGRLEGRTPAVAVMLDSRGRQMTSEAFADWLGTQRDRSTQHIVFAIGPADGWAADSLRRAQLVLSLGLLTLPHAIARLVVAEQIYRAFTILSGHPYHCGH